MRLGVPSLVDDFAGLRVAVVGEPVLDVYLDGDSDALCREAPVPTVALRDRSEVAGGAANAAANLARLGARVSIAGIVGDDAEGGALRRVLAGAGVDTAGLVAERDRRTVAKHRLLAGGQMVARFDQGSVEPSGRPSVDALVDAIDSVCAAADAVLVSDYGLGTMGAPVRRRLRRLAGSGRLLVAVDAHRLDAWRELAPTVVKPNYQETLALLDLPHVSGAPRAELVAMHASRILEATGAALAAVTLDSEGALLLRRGAEPYRTWARQGVRARVAGAGDTYVATLVLALAAGAEPELAAELASTAAGIVVEKDGTAVCSAAELREALHDDGAKEIVSLDRLRNCVALHREAGRRIVVTNGCFDILHSGHVSHLNGAKACGDVLVVGVNDDASVARLKGPGRPVNRLEDRLRVLSALSCVDHVVPFGGDSPVELIDAVRPDVYVKGGDHRRETLPEAAQVEALGGEVRLLPYLEGRSTSGIIRRVSHAVAGAASVSGGLDAPRGDVEARRG